MGHSLFTRQAAPPSPEVERRRRALCEHQTLLRAIARRLCRGDDDSAADLVQETLRRGFEHCTDREISRAWLCTSLHNLFIDLCRRQRTRGTVALNEEHLAASTELAEVDVGPWDRLSAEDHLAAVEELPPKFRVAYRAVILEKQEPAKVALELGVKPGTLRTRICRARQKLKDALILLLPRPKESP